MNGDWFYSTEYDVFGDGGKATKRSLSGNHARWIITLSKGFKRKDIGKISKSLKAYVCLVLTSQIQARSSIVGNSASVVINSASVALMFTGTRVY